MNKIIIVILVVGIILVGAFLFLRGRAPIDTALFDGDEAELSAFENNLDLFSKDGAVLDEINQTFGDILDEGVGVSSESSLDLASLDAEAAGVDFSGDLNIFDENILQELDQSFGEVLQ